MQTQSGAANIFNFTPTESDVQQTLFSLATVLPEQFYSPSFTSQVERPEASLMRAVLEEALTCFQNQFYLHHGEAQRLGKEAESWFFSDATDWPFSFVNICTALHLEPTYIRRGLRNWRANCPLKAPQRKRRAIGTRRPLKLVA